MSSHTINELLSSELGKKTVYVSHYDPELLFAIPRKGNREEIGVPALLPFVGYDRWNHYEVSWLNKKGKPIVAIAEIVIPCDSPNIIESKSMKLYFNSFNNTHFENSEEVACIIQKDLERFLERPVSVTLQTLPFTQSMVVLGELQGVNIDDLDVSCSMYTVQSSFLVCDEEEVCETLCSNLLKSNCPVTNQPDWASVAIHYRGKKINRQGLLRYIVSLRNHNEFHEQCIERIFMDILTRCAPVELTVDGRYTRRGGLDINPYRSTKKDGIVFPNNRLCRQ